MTPLNHIVIQNYNRFLKLINCVPYVLLSDDDNGDDDLSIAFSSIYPRRHEVETLLILHKHIPLKCLLIFLDSLQT